MKRFLSLLTLVLAVGICINANQPTKLLTRNFPNLNNVEAASNQNIHVYSVAKDVIVTGVEAGTEISVYDPAGILVARRISDGFSTRISLDNYGTYIVTADGATFKLQL